MKTKTLPAPVAAQHTPGPWKADGAIDLVMCDDYRESAVEVLTEDGRETVCYATSDANARLIASAPDLLAALGAAWDFVENVTQDDPERDRKFFAVRAVVRAAIAKAEGRTP